MKLSVPGVEQAVSAQEWQVRVDLAALYRLVASFGWDDLVFTHLFGIDTDQITEGACLVLVESQGC